MKVQVTENDLATIIKLEGEMMLGYEANDFHEAISSTLDKGKRNIIVDLSKVRFISSWGIGILMYGYTTATNGKGTFKLACVPENIKETFSKIKVDKIFQQYDTVEDALKN